MQADVYELDKFDRDRENRITDEKQWALLNTKIYLLLAPNINIKAFEKKINSYIVEHEYNKSILLKLVPLTDVRHTFGSELTFNLSYIRTFTVTGLLLLLCVFFNFTNLLLNRIYLRNKEMKLRNAIGADKKNLVIQLLLELTLLVGISFLLASCLLELTVGGFSHLFETTLQRKLLFSHLCIITGISWLILTIVSLPLFLHFVRASSLLISGGISPTRKSGYRKISMILQLCICIFFLMSTFIMFRQISFMKHKNLGFQKEGLIQITMLNDDREGTAREIASLPIVKELVLAKFFSIVHEPFTQNDVEWEGKSPNAKADFQILEVSKNFLHAFRIPLLKGRLLEDTDLVKGNRRLMSSKALINEEAARIMGYTDPIGKKFSFWNNQQQDVEIVGVVKDFQSASLRKPILPVIIILHPAPWSSYCYYVKVNPGDEKNAIKACFFLR